MIGVNVGNTTTNQERCNSKNEQEKLTGLSSFLLHLLSCSASKTACFAETAAKQEAKPADCLSFSWKMSFPFHYIIIN